MKHMKTAIISTTAAGLLALYGGTAQAGSVNNTDSFAANTPATAASVNTKFSEFGAAINDNDTRITAIENQGDPNADGTFDISDIAGTYGGAMFKMGNLVKGGNYARNDATGEITNPDNYFLDSFGTGAFTVTIDASGVATIHIIRERGFESAHYTGVEAGTTNPAFDSSRSKVDNVCDVTAVTASPANIVNGGPLEQCDVDGNATDNSDSSQDPPAMTFVVISPTMRSIGSDLIDNTTGDKFKLRGYVSKDGNIITLRVFERWCGTGYDTVNNKCTGGTFVGYGLMTLTRVN